MKQILLPLSTLILTIFLASFVYHPDLELAPLPTSPLCLQQQSQTQLCAQCFVRSSLIQPHKSILVQSQKQFAIIKIPSIQTFLNCSQFLQFADYSVGQGHAVIFQQLPAILQNLKELQGVIVPSRRGKELVEAYFQQIIVYGWFASGEDRTAITVSYVSHQHVIAIYHFLFYLVNGAVALVGVFWSFDNHLIEQIDHPGSYLIFCGLVALQFATAPYSTDPEFALNAARITIPTAILLRLQIRYNVVIAYFILGFLLSPNLGTLPLYSLLGLLCTILGGWDKNTMIVLWYYVSFTLLMMFVNYVGWAWGYSAQSDSVCRIIQFSLLTFTWTALLLLSEYQPSAHAHSSEQNRAIYLGGYEEEQMGHL